MSSYNKFKNDDGKMALSARDAALRLSCAQDYVGRLCREGKLRGFQKDGQWYVELRSLTEFEKARVAAKLERSEKLAEQRRQESLEYRKRHNLVQGQEQKAIISAPTVSKHKGFFNAIPQSVSLAVGAATLLLAVVFAGATSLPQFGSQAQVAAIGHVQSPFFGITPGTFTLPTHSTTSLSQSLIGRLFSSLFGKKDHVVAVTPSTPFVSSHVSAPSAQTIVQNTYPVVERIVQTSVTGNWVTTDMLVVMLGDLQRSMRKDMRTTIEQMLDLDFFTSTQSGGGGITTITDADVPDTITASNYLPLAGGTLTGGLIGTDALFSNATTTNFAATGVASTTSLVISGAGGSGTRCLQVGPTGIVSANASGCGGSGAPGGNDTEVQYNDSGSFAGNAAFTFNDTTGQLSVTNILTSGITATFATSTRLAIMTAPIAPSYIATSSTASIFPFASSTAITVSGTGYFDTASTSNLIVSSLGSSAGQCLTINSFGGVTTVACGSGGGAAFPFTPAGYGNSTSTTIGFTNGILSTASSTFTSTLFLSSLTNSGLAVNASGQVYAAATTTFSSPLVYSNGNVTIQTANGSQSGVLSSADWTTFNNKVSSSSLASSITGIFPFTSTGYGNSTSTTIGFTNGILSTASSTFTSTVILSTLSNSGLGVNSLGQVYAAATTTFSGALAYSNGNVTCNTASGSVFGCLTSADWTTFNSKVSSSSLSSLFPFTPTAIGNATSTLMQFTGGLIANASSTITALNTINATSTNFSATNASTTNLTISSLGGAAGQCLTVTSSGSVITTTCGTNGAAFPFTPAAWGNSTSTTIGFTNGIISNASSTFTSALNFSNFSNGSLAVNSAGGVYTAATTTFASPLTYANGVASIQVANGSQNGYLSNTDWTTFNNKVSSSSLASAVTNAFPFTSSTNFGTLANATSTTVWFQNGLQASTTARFSSLTASYATTTFASTTVLSANTICLSTDCRTSWPTAGANFGQAWEIFGSTYLAPTSTIKGIIAAASSTIGSGAQAGGLTISGGATTTGNLIAQGNITVTGSFFGANLGTCNTSADKLLWNNGQFTCGTDQTGGGAGTDVNWTFFNGSGVRPATTTNQVVIGGSATSSLVSPLAKLGVFGGASIDSATTTNLAVISVLSSILSTNVNGSVLTTTVSAPLQFSANTLSISQANGSTNGYLSNTDWTLFNNKVSSSSLSSSVTSAFPFTPTAIGNATSTLIQFTAGLIANASSTIGSGAQGGGLTVAGGATTTGTLYVAGTGTSTINGGLQVFGNLVPGASDIYSLGTADYPWQHLYVGANSLYVNGQQVVSTNAGDDVVIKASPNENLVIQSSGTANIEINPIAGQIQLKNTINVSAGKSITTSDLSALPVPNGIAAGNITIATNSISATNLNGGISLTPSGTGGVYVTSGNLGVGTTSPLAKLDVYGNAILSGQNRYINFDFTVGSSGYGFRDNAGILEYKNSAGAWSPFSGVSTSSLSYWYSQNRDWELSGGYLTPTSTVHVLRMPAGFLSQASSTIGNGTATGGLTINGGATTTGNSVLQGALTVAGNTGLQNATSTTLAISSITSAILKTNSNGSVVAAVPGTDYLTSANLTSAFPFTPAAWGNSTSTTIGFQSGIIANASSTFTSTLFLSSLTNGGLAVNAAGQVYKAATTTYSGALTYSNGNVTCNTASGSQAGCLSTTDWTTFNNKVSSSSLSA
ncbi:MAG: helix-turn-helix domain-containing protein, partial [Candidatus Pacebacteria bacterium]|nr:helix-turn-helix domain-containing protein [Candidatus Paceibacterota bacterium]